MIYLILALLGLAGDAHNAASSAAVELEYPDDESNLDDIANLEGDI